MTTILNRLFRQLAEQFQPETHEAKHQEVTRDPLFKKPGRVRATIQDEVEGPAQQIGGIFRAPDEGPDIMRPGPHDAPSGQITRQ
jgi:hypothetical protein